MPEGLADTLVLDRLTLDRADGDGRSFSILAVPALTLEPGTSLGVSGPSGSGKSSLLHLVAGLITPSAGRVSWSGNEISALGESERDCWRRRTVGFVFQDFHLIPELDVVTNIALPASFSSWRLDATDRRRALDLAEQVGLADPRRRAAVLSRGEQQRVAIARALFGKPTLLLADEPTASLDAARGDAISALLIDAAASCGATLICASHDAALLARMDRRLDLTPAPVKHTP